VPGAGVLADDDGKTKLVWLSAGAGEEYTNGVVVGAAGEDAEAGTTGYWLVTVTGAEVVCTMVL